MKCTDDNEWLAAKQGSEEATFALVPASQTTGKQLGSEWRDDAVTGFDLTFSGPKSVSTLWALADADTAAAIDLSHAAAVDAALGYLEEHASLSRRGRDGVEQISSAGFSGALIDHTTSRTGDPQLQTRTLVVHKVRCVDGWLAVDRSVAAAARRERSKATHSDVLSRPLQPTERW